MDRDDEDQARGFFDDHGYWPTTSPRTSALSLTRHQLPAVQ
jgi:hypothetical protein